MRLSTPTTRQLFHSRDSRRCRWCMSAISLPQPLFPHPYFTIPHPLTTNHPDLRRLPNRPPSPTLLLLRHRRMFPLALLHPPSPHQPPHNIPPPTALSFRNRNRSYRPQHHNLLSPQQPQPTPYFPLPLYLQHPPLTASIKPFSK